MLTLTSWFVAFNIWFAQAAPGLGGIEGRINTFVAALRPISRPMIVLGLTLIFLSWVASGVLPEWAQSYKGVFTKILLGAVLLSVVPEIAGLIAIT